MILRADFIQVHVYFVAAFVCLPASGSHKPRRAAESNHFVTNK